MKRRRFLQSLVAVAAIAFAKPLAMLEPEVPRLNPAWVDAEYEIWWVGVDGITGVGRSFEPRPYRYNLNKQTGLLEQVV